MTEPISGFSKLSKEEKIDWITTNYTKNAAQSRKILQTYWNLDQNVQQLHDEFIENTITNLYVPQGIAPNFLINDTLYAIPMAIEESSVIAAASKAAKFWLKKGGFKTTILGTEKVGQVHFIYKGDTNRLNSFFTYLKPILLAESASLTSSMEKRGGGITDIVLKDKTKQLENYYQLHATFETKDAMGANFINSCLEQFAATLKKEAGNYDDFSKQEKDIEVVMSILSNYVPNCSVRAEVSCPVEDLKLTEELTPQHTAEKIVQAIKIAHVEPYRAVTHNKGIMNGIDAVVLTTGNDFRAIEAGVHAYACRNGQYSSLTHASIEDGIFTFWIELPLALGTVGGLTNLHPLVKLNLEILQRPSAEELMQIIAVAGLAQNFAAVSSLVTTGIQKGHMKMHLLNILNQLGANENEKAKLVTYFKTNPVTHHGVELQLNEIRK
ncbi:MAG TPA: hydroxymethylglutaryl-CoA reductase, degradative [Maribacter sp.]|uniref:hydroxymethylglutaryl-CoA reductase, degradative n=1 Tax=unclassified Maribacter TaxID=2615042 RepID=UPI000EBF9D37|nr:MULTISPECIES: hydroxymethylglutaryl-CoA reductase, degradative [unclassified Maribacter]HAF78731.1 hydroxymethylglutaryl-CoA reductase, degradative [Maribacter sp.]|tara:strand:+ start:75152 stop:76468 length:1317 start_codon:yes stop_codon:yes gene_type:complete